MESTFDAVKALIVEVIKPKEEVEITADTRFIEDLKADSMDQFFLVDGLCEKFDINIPDEAALEIHTVGDAVAAVDKLLQEKSA